MRSAAGERTDCERRSSATSERKKHQQRELKSTTRRGARNLNGAHKEAARVSSGPRPRPAALSGGRGAGSCPLSEFKCNALTKRSANREIDADVCWRHTHTHTINRLPLSSCLERSAGESSWCLVDESSRSSRESRRLIDKLSRRRRRRRVLPVQICARQS